MAIPISFGAGQASIASEKVGNLDYQQIKVIGGETGSTSVWGIAPDGSGRVSVVGRVSADIAGSVVAYVSGTPSVSGTVNIGDIKQSVFGASIVGAPPANIFVGGALATTSNPVPVSPPASGFLVVNTSNSSVISYVQNSVATVIIGGSVAAAVTPAANQSVSGTTGASVIGWVPIQPSNTSVLTVWQSPSVVGTYAEDAAHTSGDKGIFGLGVRNDTFASVTSSDGDYSPATIDTVGAMMVHEAPITKWVQGTADLRVVQGASVTAVPAQGASVFTYIQSAQVANFGPSSVLVSFGGGLGSILSYTIAPAGGGSNVIFRPAIKTGENSAFTASINGTASVLISAQGFVSKT